jgi:hypothetical protein
VQSVGTIVQIVNVDLFPGQQYALKYPLRMLGQPHDHKHEQGHCTMHWVAELTLGGLGVLNAF